MCACVFYFFSPRQAWRRCGQVVSVRGGGPEGKPPAEERRVPRPEEDESAKGFDNFLPSPLQKKKKAARKTHVTAHSLYLEVSIRCQSYFLRRHSLRGTSDFCVCVFCLLHFTSLQQNQTFLLFLKWLPDRKPGHEMKINQFPSSEEKKKKLKKHLSEMSSFFLRHSHAKSQRHLGATYSGPRDIGILSANWRATGTNEMLFPGFRGLTFSVINFIYLFSRTVSVMVIKKGSGQF